MTTLIKQWLNLLSGHIRVKSWLFNGLFISAPAVLVVLGLTFIIQSPSYAVGIPQGDWQLTSLNSQPPLKDTKITTTFDSDDQSSGKVTGSGGCNRYFGSYTSKGESSGQIHIGSVGSTYVYCGEPIVRQEYSFFQALESVENYKVSNSTLSLTNPTNTNLEFSLVP